ncbi:TerB family tellurite resistance protein [Magnetospira thiophila]
MNKKLEKLFEGPLENNGKVEFTSLQIAVGGLLVKAAQSDAHFHDLEKEAIHGLLATRFNLTPAQVDALLVEVEEVLAGPHGIYSCSMVVMDELASEDRVRLLEMVWEVMFADGILHNFEAGLMQRLSPLLDIDANQMLEIRDRVHNRGTT